MLNEIHRDRIPGVLQDRKLLQGSIRAMTQSFGSATSSAGLAKLGNIGAKTRPSVLASDEVGGLVLSKMTCQGMIMMLLEDAESEIINVQYIDKIVLA